MSKFEDELPAVIPKRDIRQFCALCIAVPAALFVFSWIRHGWPTPVAWTFLVVGLLTGLCGILYTPLGRPTYMLAMAVSGPISQVMSVFMLGVVYFGVLTPLALVFRAMGRDSLQRRAAGAESYWQERPQRGSLLDYLKQYQKQ